MSKKKQLFKRLRHQKTLVNVCNDDDNFDDIKSNVSLSLQFIQRKMCKIGNNVIQSKLKNIEINQNIPNDLKNIITNDGLKALVLLNKKYYSQDTLKRKQKNPNESTHFELTMNDIPKFNDVNILDHFQLSKRLKVLDLMENADNESKLNENEIMYNGDGYDYENLFKMVRLPEFKDENIMNDGDIKKPVILYEQYLCIYISVFMFVLNKCRECLDINELSDDDGKQNQSKRMNCIIHDIEMELTSQVKGMLYK